MDTSLGVSYPTRTLMHTWPSPVQKKKKRKKKKKDITSTQEQQESNVLSQNKKSIHALKSNSVFEN